MPFFVWEFPSVSKNVEELLGARSPSRDSKSTGIGTHSSLTSLSNSHVTFLSLPGNPFPSMCLGLPPFSTSQLFTWGLGDSYEIRSSLISICNAQNIYPTLTSNNHRPYPVMPLFQVWLLGVPPPGTDAYHGAELLPPPPFINSLFSVVPACIFPCFSSHLFSQILVKGMHPNYSLIQPLVT